MNPIDVSITMLERLKNIDYDMLMKSDTLEELGAKCGDLFKTGDITGSEMNINDIACEIFTTLITWIGFFKKNNWDADFFLPDKQHDRSVAFIDTIIQHIYSLWHYLCSICNASDKLRLFAGALTAIVVLSKRFHLPGPNDYSCYSGYRFNHFICTLLARISSNGAKRIFDLMMRNPNFKDEDAEWVSKFTNYFLNIFPTAFYVEATEELTQCSKNGRKCPIWTISEPNCNDFYPNGDVPLVSAFLRKRYGIAMKMYLKESIKNDKS